MTTALPSATTATSASATEADVKNFLIQLRDYLNGLLGATGLPADARTALGVTSLTSQAVVTALGFTPANLANSASDHNHNSTYAPMTAVVSIGNYFLSGQSYVCRATRANGATMDFAVAPYSDGGS